MPRDERDDDALLWDMLYYARTVRRIVGERTFEQYIKNEEFRMSIERGIEIIGEAARHISDAFAESHPEIPWRAIRAQRHILAHEYGEIQHDKIWRVATEHIPALVTQLEPIVPEAPSSQTE